MNDRDITREQILSTYRMAVDVWLSSVGTIGDDTSMERALRFEGATPQQLMDEVGLKWHNKLSLQDYEDLSALLRNAGCNARKILENDSIGQRAERTADAAGDMVDLASRMLATGLVRGSDDTQLPPMEWRKGDPNAPLLEGLPYCR